MQKILIYLLNRKIPNKEEFRNVELEGWEEYYDRLKFIGLVSEDEVVEDLTYRSLELYADIYFVINGNDVFLKLKTCSFDSQIKLDNISEIVTEIAGDESGIVDNGRMLAENYIPGSKFKSNTSEKIINVYREKGKDFKLNVSKEYEDFFILIDVDNLDDIYKIEYRINHYPEYRIFILFKEQRQVFIKNVKDRFDVCRWAEPNTERGLERICKR